MATKAAKTKASTLPECPYGARCYRKNPQHFVEFFHPKKSKTDDDGSTSASMSASSDATDGPSPPKLPTTDDSSLPACKYGAKCYRKNLMHFAEYSHPTKVVAGVSGDDSGDDTDEISDEDSTAANKDVKTSDILKRGMSLVKTYSKMTEDERKELIKKAMEAKKQLQDELEKTKEEVKKKGEEVDKLQKQVATGSLLMEGEEAALKGTKTTYFDLAPERAYKEGSAAQTHFRLAESQFYRLLSGESTCYRLTKVEYVVNPELVKNFKKCRENLKKKHGEQFSYPVLAFHGTEEKNIVPICETGFSIPGESGHDHRTDTGWYGKGVYFSEYPSYSMNYISGSQKFLLCQVLPGKVYNCTKLIHGAALSKGHDSHTSPDKKELVIFNKYHILPSYIVHYTHAKTEFTYKDQSKATTAGTKKAVKAAATKAKGGKKKPKKKKALTEDEMFDTLELGDLFQEARDCPESDIFEDRTVQFTGKFTGTQKEMMDLAKKHGAHAGTKVVFDLLFATKEEFEMNSSKCFTAMSKGKRIVGERYLYDCIINQELLEEEPYDLEVLLQ